MTKQELINWMTEIRKDFTFSKKVQLIKEFWDNKDIIDQLKKDVQSWKDAYQIERTKNQALDKKNAEKDDRITQFDKLFQGTAVIFQKQHNYVDQLKKQLEQEIKAKGISEEQATHLQADIDRLDKEKQELDRRDQELEKARTESEKIRDQELSNLRAEKQVLETRLKVEGLSDNDKNFLKYIQEFNASQPIDLSHLPPIWCKIKNSDKIITAEVGSYENRLSSLGFFKQFLMEGLEKEHQKVNTLTQQLKNIQDIDAQIYTVLSQGSNETGLLPRTQAVIKELNKTRQDLANANNQVSLWTTNYNTANGQLSLWISTFPKENASQVQTRINTLTSNQITQSELNAISYAQLVINSVLYPAMSQQNTSYFNTYQYYFNSGGVLSPSYYSTYGRMNPIIQGLYNIWTPSKTNIQQISSLKTQSSTITSLQSQLTTANAKLQREQGWWDKWISDKRKSFGDNSSQDEKPKYNLWFTVCCEQQSYNYLPRGVHLEYHGSNSREPGTEAFKEQNAKLALKNLIYQYYRDK